MFWTFAACKKQEEKPAEKYPSNAITINNIDELYLAINNQKDGDYWVLKAGTYTLDPSKSNIEVKMNENEQTSTGWQMPLVANNITVVGEGDVKIVYDFSGSHTGNGEEKLQNLISVVGDNVTLDGLKLVSNGGENVNKAIWVIGKNLTLKNLNITTDDATGFAGSIYFSNNYKQFGYPNGTTNVGTDHHASDSDVGTVTMSNVTLNKSRITATGAGKGKFVFDNVGITWKDIDQSHSGKDFCPMYNLLNSGKTFTFDHSDKLKVVLSKKAIGGEGNVDAVKALIPTGAKIEVVD